MKVITINQLSSHFYREYRRAQMQKSLNLRKDVMHYKKLRDSRRFKLTRIQEKV